MFRIENNECTVQYLKDSRAIVNGIDFDQDLINGIINAPPGQFTPLGSRESSAAGEVFIGVKKRGLPFKSRRHLHEIATAETLLRADAGFHRHLPLFTLGVTDGLDEIGILTEDFTENGRYELDETPRRVGPLKPLLPNMPEKIVALRAAIVEALDNRVDPTSLNRSFGAVCGKLVLFDFDEIADGWSALEPARRETYEFASLAQITLPPTH